MDRLPKSKINVIRRYYLRGELKGAKIARELGIQRDTVAKYFKDFKEIERLYPNKIKDFDFFLPKADKSKTPRYYAFLDALPGLIENLDANYIEILSLWKAYRILHPTGYHLYHFSIYFNRWRKENKLCYYYHRRVKIIPPEDEVVLNHWRLSKNIELWRKAVVILDSAKARPVADISIQVEVSVPTILVWIDRYKTMGISSLEHKTFTPDPKKVASNQIKRENLLKLLQQTPKLHGINRTSWSLMDLSRVYGKVYEQPLGSHAIGKHLRQMGYQFQKSRERLTSPDKHFQQKMDKIKSILSNLKPDEKFFSIDEYGPAVVNMKPGWSITKEGEVKVVPQLQKSRGWYILTAALEMSANQVTHFYSQRKNTFEMIKLIDVLCQQYKGNTTLYISWDCASWHGSKILKGHLEQINTDQHRLSNGTPIVVLAPLPSSAQYLNVIESVFSGMAKSIIHNSDYADLDECKAAIDRYFDERNQHFQLNPKRAGKKIWGNEIVASVFKEVNNTKSKLKPIRVKYKLATKEQQGK